MLTIESNNSLTSLEGLNNLDSVQSIRLKSQHNISDLTVFDGLKYCEYLHIFGTSITSLSGFDSLIYLSLAIGFPLLTLGIFIGAVWLYRVAGVLLGWDPKIVASLVTWLLYAALLHARLLAGWRGRKLAAASVIGFALILFTFIGVGLATTGFHRFFEIP